MSTMVRLRWLALVSVVAFVTSNVLTERFASDEPVEAATTASEQGADVRPGRGYTQLAVAAQAAVARNQR